MKCQYFRLAILDEPQTSLIHASRHDFIMSTLGKNAEFFYHGNCFYYSPRLIADDLIAGVFERKRTEELKSGPYNNKVRTAETFETANFAFSLIDDQKVAVQVNSRVTSNLAGLLDSLSTYLNSANSQWAIDFRPIRSKQILDDYLRKHSGALKVVKITLLRPNASTRHFEALHDDLKESLERKKADRIKKEYYSESAKIEPDEEMKHEMNFAIDGNGKVSASNRDDNGLTLSFDSEQTDTIKTVEENREIDLSEEDDKREIANNMLNKPDENDD